jgi:hypothetical protein
MTGTAAYALSGYATLATAVVAAVVGLGTLQERSRSDRRDQWWQRVQWALDRALDGQDQDVATAGISMLEVLARSPHTDADDARMLEAAWEPVLERTRRRREAGGVLTFRVGPAGERPMTGRRQEPEHETPQPGAPERRDGVVPVSRLEVAAARLRIVTDAKQGKASPEWVERLAAATDAD